MNVNSEKMFHTLLRAVLILMLPPQLAHGAKIAHVSPRHQRIETAKAKIWCDYLKVTDTPSINGTYCPMTWDNITCWNATAAGTTASKPCPNYIHKFNLEGVVLKTCTENGTWYVHPTKNRTWTNYTGCTTGGRGKQHTTDYPRLIAEHMETIEMIFTIGYGVSLFSLTIAIFLMVYFKRLHCPRNIIHINLFVSFALRATMSFLKVELMVNGVGLPSDVTRDASGNVIFLEDEPHWECRLLISLFNYLYAANYMWILVEGLYLHMLLSVAVFSERSGLKWYILFGWCTPLTFIIPWIIVRATLENVLCWTTHPTPGYFWLIRGPISATVVINFGFFCNIIRVLFTKLHAVNSPEARKFRYRKLAKSTLVLIPLFGVNFIVFVAIPDGLDERLEIVKLYYEMFFGSFQGFFVALLYCFLNGEVQGEIMKKWRRYRLRNRSFCSARGYSTTTTEFSRARGSVALNPVTADAKELQRLNSDCGGFRNVIQNGVSTGGIDDSEKQPMMSVKFAK